MIKAQFLIGQHFLSFDIIKKLENIISGNAHPPNVKMTLKRTKLIYESSLTWLNCQGHVQEIKTGET